jgi:hypothetical protein
MRTTGWSRTLAVGAVTALTLGTGHPDSSTVIVGGSPAQRGMARWALARFAAEGLALPPLKIRFSASSSVCGEGLGFYGDGVATVCGSGTTRMTRRTLLHEMAHGWANSNLSLDEQVRFLGSRGLKTWNDDGVAWEERGFEQAAEVMSWALCDQGTEYLRPLIPDNSIEQLTKAYALLTGKPLPVLAAWDPRGPFS